jgi:hypothetical protein
MLRIGVVTVVVALTLAVALAASGLASGMRPRDGYYDGAPANTDGNTISLVLELAVSGNGHRVSRIDPSYVDFTCLGNVDAGLLLPTNRTAVLSADDGFSVTLPSKDSESENGQPNQPNGKVVLSGTFGTDGTVSGKLAFTGSGLLHGCNRSIRWKGQARPLMDYFTGTVTQGSNTATFSFYRTIETHPKTTDFSVGVLTATCASGSPPAQVSLQSGYSLAVHPNAKFGGNIFFTSGDAGSISGAFQNATHATGKLAYVGRDDCSYNVPWSAHRVAANVPGPFNFDA